MEVSKLPVALSQKTISEQICAFFLFFFVTAQDIHSLQETCHIPMRG